MVGNDLMLGKSAIGDITWLCLQTLFAILMCNE